MSTKSQKVKKSKSQNAFALVVSVSLCLCGEFGALLLSGCDNGGSAHSVRDQLAASETQSQRDDSGPDRLKPQASSLKSHPNPVAIVNGEAIDRSELLAILLESRGLATLQQMILEEVAVQEARRQGLSVKAADIDREYDLTLQANRFNGHDPEKLTPARREKIVDDWCRKNGVTREELAIAMRRQAHLRPLADQRISITEAMLKQEYDRVHGEKAVVRHVQLAAPRFYPQFKERLDQGESFEVLVTKFSQNVLSREQAGLLPPFSASDDTVPAVFVKAAFAMQPGDVSNLIEAEGSFHILKLERRIPADEAAFEDVRAHLEKNMRARLVAQEMEALAERLLLAAQLQIKDKVLHGQYQKRLGTKEIVGPPLAGP